MDAPTLPAAIGVDGGATTCRFALRIGDRVVRHKGPGVNATTDPTGAIDVLHDGLSQLAAMADLSEPALTKIPAFFGLAGLKDATTAAAIADALPLTQIRIEEDRLPAVVGALGDAPGSVAAIGTGSFIARQTPQGIRYAGGWGLVLGDEASGAWLGRELLAAALRAEDGFGAHTDLTQTALATLGGPTGTVQFAKDAAPKDFAAETRVRAILNAAQAGDPVATELMRRGADYIEKALMALGHTKSEPLCLIGGVAPAFRPYLSPNLTLLRPKGTALDGALALAARIGMDG